MNGASRHGSERMVEKSGIGRCPSASPPFPSRPKFYGRRNVDSQRSGVGRPKAKDHGALPPSCRRALRQPLCQSACMRCDPFFLVLSHHYRQTDTLHHMRIPTISESPFLPRIRVFQPIWSRLGGASLFFQGNGASVHQSLDLVAWSSESSEHQKTFPPSPFPDLQDSGS